MPIAWDIFADYLYLLNKMYSVEIFSFVLMPNHFHLICRDPLGLLPVGMAIFMRETSKELGRIGGRINRIWGAPYFSSVIGDPIYYLHAYKYVFRNPVAAKLSVKAESYRWSTLQGLLGQFHCTIPVIPDETLFSDVEGTLDWLNRSYSAEDAVSIQRALKRKKFGFARDPSSCKPNWLATQESIPHSLSLRI